MRTISQWWQGTKAYALIQAREAAGQAVLVEGGQATARAAVCADCEHNQVPKDAGWLEKWANGRMRERVGQAGTVHDDRLGVCGMCSCELRSIVHFHSDLLRVATAASALNKLPDHCWKRKELA